MIVAGVTPLVALAVSQGMFSESVHGSDPPPEVIVSVWLAALKVAMVVTATLSGAVTICAV